MMSINEGIRLILKDLSEAHGRYIDEFFGLSCAPSLLELKLYPNAKEITESMAAFRAVRNNLTDFSLNDPTVHLFAVGDGFTPRTAALFAHRTRWQCHSIDPGLKDRNKWQRIKRLHIYPCKIEDIVFYVDKAVIVAVHSHASLQVTLKSIKAEQMGVVAIPCCTALYLDKEPDKSYTDKSCWSPKNEVKIWKGIKE